MFLEIKSQHEATRTNAPKIHVPSPSVTCYPLLISKKHFIRPINPAETPAEIMPHVIHSVNAAFAARNYAVLGPIVELLVGLECDRRDGASNSKFRPGEGNERRSFDCW